MKKYALILLCLVAALALFACSKASLNMDSNTVSPGATVQVKWTAPGSYADNAWIGIIPSGIDHGSEAVNDQHDITYQYLSGKTSGTFTFTAPKKKGSYDFRMHDTDSNGSEVASITFTVQ